MELRGYEKQAFTAWADLDKDFSVLSFKRVSQVSGVEEHRIRRAVRGLARKGLVEFHRCCWDEDGEMRGAGYGLTTAGAAILKDASHER